MTVSDLLVSCLEYNGVTTAYGVPGEENTHMMLALEASGVDVVLTRHEQAAAYMASVHGRITGRPAICFATLGPGATNLVTGVADANLDRVPMIVLTGQGGRERIDISESHQLIDLEKLFEPVTKFSRTLRTEKGIEFVVAEALRQAVSPRPGAVHLSIPEDLAAKAAHGEPMKVSTSGKLPVQPDALAMAAHTLRGAKAPLIVAGAGVVRAGASHELLRFVQETRIPVASTLMAKGVMPSDHELYLHSVGLPFEDHIDDVIAEAGLIIAIGFDPVEYSAAKLTRDGKIPVVHVSDVAAKLDVGWRVSCDVAGDIGTILRGLTAGLMGHIWPENAVVRDTRMRILAQKHLEHNKSNGLHPADVLRVLESQIEKDTLVLSGVGTHKMEVARYLDCKQPGQIILPNGLAGMGLALPGAIAAGRLGRHGRIFAIVGDGEFLMNIQEMETAERLGLSLTVLLWEDGGYGLIEAKQQDDVGQHTDLSFGNPRWNALCRAFGWRHEHVDSVENLSKALENNTIGLNLITLPVNYDQALQRDDIYRLDSVA